MIVQLLRWAIRKLDDTADYLDMWVDILDRDDDRWFGTDN